MEDDRMDNDIIETEVEKRPWPRRLDCQVGSDGSVLMNGRQVAFEYSKTGIPQFWIQDGFGRMKKVSLPSVLKETFFPEAEGRARYMKVRPVSLGIDNLEIVPRKSAKDEGGKDEEASGFDGLVEILKTLGKEVDSADASSLETVRGKVHAKVDEWFDNRRKKLEKERTAESPFWTRIRFMNMSANRLQDRPETFV